MPFTFAPTSTGTGGAVNMGTTAGQGAAGTLQGNPVFDPASGTYVNSITGTPYSGTWGGQVYSSGALSTPTGQPGSSAKPGTPGAAPTGNPNVDYAAVNIPKNAATSEDVQNLQTEFASNASSALKDFGSYLNDFNSDIAGARTAAANATNITPTVNALTSAQGTYAQNLGAANTAYQNALNTGAANANQVITNEENLLPSYDTAVSNVGNLEIANLGPQMARYAQASGVPGGASSALEQAEAGAVANIAAPLELQKINQAYGIQNQNLGLQETLGQRGITYAGQFLPQTAGAVYSSATGLANTVQSLKNQTAGMSYQDALQFMQAAGVPANVQAQVLGTQESEASGLEGLYGGAYYQGLQYQPGALLAQPQGFSNSLPGYPTYPSTRTGGGGGGGGPGQNVNLGGNAPQQVGGGTTTQTVAGGGGAVTDPSGQYSFDPSAGTYYVDNNTGNVYPLGTGPAAAWSSNLSAGVSNVAATPAAYPASGLDNIPTPSGIYTGDVNVGDSVYA